MRLHRGEVSSWEEGMEGGSGRQRNKEMAIIREMPKGKMWVDFPVSELSLQCSSVRVHSLQTDGSMSVALPEPPCAESHLLL